jgi:hypothetical protein
MYNLVQILKLLLSTEYLGAMTRPAVQYHYQHALSPLIVIRKKAWPPKKGGKIYAAIASRQNYLGL